MSYHPAVSCTLVQSFIADSFLADVVFHSSYCRSTKLLLSISKMHTYIYAKTLLLSESVQQHSFKSARPSPTDIPRCSYEQIGLKFKLYSAEILFNQALAYFRMNQTGSGMQLLEQASREKQIPEHGVIDQAIATFGRDFTVFSLPPGMRTLYWIW